MLLMHVSFIKKSGLQEGSTRLLRKIRNFCTGLLRPKEVDKSYTFKIPVFTQSNHPFFLSCINLSSGSLCIRVLCLCRVSLCNNAVMHKFDVLRMLQY